MGLNKRILSFCHVFKTTISFKFSNLCSVFNCSMPNTWRIIVLKAWGMSTAGLALYIFLRNQWFICCGLPLRNSKVRAAVIFPGRDSVFKRLWMSHILKHLHWCFRQHRWSKKNLENLWRVYSRASNDSLAKSELRTQTWKHGRCWTPAWRSC